MSAAANTLEGLMTLGQAAVALGCRDWHLARLFERRLVPEPARVGRQRVFTADDLPPLRQALIEAGYLSVSQEE
jgi:hypothetical protein